MEQSTESSSMDYLPKNNREYKKKEYWDERFRSESNYDWLAKFQDVQQLISNYVNKNDKILMVGCGNSTFSEDMYNAGYKTIVNLDFSKVVIDKMKQIHADKPEMKWIHGDMLVLTEFFSQGSFDVVIDKAAMDALMCDEGDVWSPQTHILEAAAKMSNGISKILTSKGTFLQISFGQPHFRKRYLMSEEFKDLNFSKCYQWGFEYHTIDVGLGYFFYVMKKSSSEEEK